MTAQVAEAVLPRVSGRHRDRALASARKCRAIQLKLQGLTYQQIADELGYTSRGTVYKIIKTAQATQLTDAVEERRAARSEGDGSRQDPQLPGAAASQRPR